MVSSTISQVVSNVQSQTTSSNLSPVVFHGDTIFCVERNGEPYAPVKPIVENMGLDWSSQYVKLNANSKRWSTIVMITTVEDGKNRDAVCMPVRKLPAFLSSINPKKVKPELRERIELYQDECDDALWNYWTKGQATHPAATLLPYQVIRTLPKSAKDRLNDLVNTKLAYVPTAFGWKTRMRIWKQFNKAFRITRYELLPEVRMTEAITFLTGMDVGHGGTVTCKTGLLPLPVNTAQSTAASLAAMIEQGQAVLASLSAHTA